MPKSAIRLKYESWDKDKLVAECMRLRNVMLGMDNASKSRQAEIFDMRRRVEELTSELVAANRKLSNPRRKLYQAKADLKQRRAEYEQSVKEMDG